MFSEQEIRDNVFSLPGEKSSGPNGFPQCFYHHYWDLIKGDLIEIFQFLHQSKDTDALRSINQTFITLIPKKLNVEKV